MPNSNGSDTLSNFKRDTSRFLKRLRRTRKPVVLTVKGGAEVVVQDAAAYRQLLALAEKIEMMTFLQKSREDVDAGRTVSAEEVLERLARKLKPPTTKD